MIAFRLFGAFELRTGNDTVTDLDNGKAGELLCYLLLNRNRSIGREVLADLLWGKYPPSNPGKTFNQILWRLRSRFAQDLGLDLADVITQHPKWLRCDLGPEVTIDALAFESAYQQVQNLNGHELDAETAAAIRQAVASYRGGLLPGWYQDWCRFEQSRFQQMYLDLLNQLVDHCEQTGEFAGGIAYGLESLRLDPACERTHRHLMRLYFCAGNRSAALRQYEQCSRMLQAEHQTKPSAPTEALFQYLRTESAGPLPSSLNTGSFELSNGALVPASSGSGTLNAPIGTPNKPNATAA